MASSWRRWEKLSEAGFEGSGRDWMIDRCQAVLFDVRISFFITSAVWVAEKYQQILFYSPCPPSFHVLPVLLTLLQKVRWVY